MKQVIRLTESDIRKLVMESARRVIKESKNEWSVGPLRRPKSSRFSTTREPQPGKDTYMGTSSEPSAVDNMKKFNDMGNPFSGLSNKIKGAVGGWKRGAEGMKDDQEMAELGNKFGVKRRNDSHGRVDMNKNYNAQRQFALVRDLEQDIEQDVEKFNLDQKTVDNALLYTTNDFRDKPEKFGVKPKSQEPKKDDEQQSMVAESVRRVLKRYIR